MRVTYRQRDTQPVDPPPETFAPLGAGPDPDRPLRWEVLRVDRALGLKPGDCLAYYIDRPKGERIVLERPFPAHEGLLDSLQLKNVTTPIGTTTLAARQILVGRLVRDREEAA